ncbi:hypothetical protein GCM10007941_31410 [Amphritea balenae]|nr:hypothetical protein GCM10007941_31410 [Amphritea balenae]
MLRNRLAQSISLTILSTALATPAIAVEFNIGEIEGRFDSQLSIGSSWRMAGQNSDLISVPNGGTGAGGGSFDDGTQNYSKGDAFSTVFKGVHDLELSKDNIGAFVRGKYWYDYALSEGTVNHGHIPNGYAANTSLDDSGFNDYAKFSGAEILDAYVFGEFELNDQPLDVRIGRQVVNWGESTFIQGGINVINPFDVNAFRRAGAEVKEGLLPVNMAFASLGLTDSLNVEAFYQLEWEKTSVDGCGTYFSTADISSEGCDGIRTPYPVPDSVYYSGASLPLPPPTPFGVSVVNRTSDGIREADDSGQFGLALRYFSEELNSTEFGLYFAKYHSRLPLISGVVTSTVISPSPLIINPFDAQYFIEYPEDTKMIGLSFSTNIDDIAWSGEISHKMDVPLQLNGAMLVGAILTGGGDPTNPASSRISAAGLGGEVSGYDQFDVTQVQTTFIKYLDQVMGASRMTLIGELGWTHIHDLDESASAIKYGRNSVFGFTGTDTEGFVTQDSLGYVVRANLSYSDVFAGVNLKPEISFKHGIEGNGPEPGAAFREGEKTATISLTADYLNQYQVRMGYTNFFGGDYNAIDDRDFLSLSASVSF